jgi:CDP-glycerol glycerophosphotransferase
LLLAQQGLYTWIAIGARYLSRRPSKPVVVLYGHQLSGNLKALFHEWERNHRDKFDCYVLCLDPSYAQQLRQMDIPVLQCNRLRHMVRVGRGSAIITDHGLHAMGAFLRFTSILFIDVWHGIPFKGFTPDDFRLQHRYDEVWVSSPLLKEIYERKFGFKPEIVKALGYARTDKLFLRQPPDTLFREMACIPAGHKVVLYAPTWQQDDRGRGLFPFGESQDEFVDRVCEICEKHMATLVIRSHLNATIASRTFEHVRYCSMKEFPDAEELLKDTDILICDWSSIAFDYLALDRPAIFLEVDPPFKHGFSLGREYRFGKIAANMEMLSESLFLALENPDMYTVEQGNHHREITAAVYGQNVDGNVTSRQLARLVELIAVS